MRHFAAPVFAFALAGTAIAVVAAAPKPSPIAAALADPARGDQASDDARRKAAEVIAFSGLKSGNSVVDLIPGQAYWTRIFAGVVGPKGRVYAIWPAAAAKYAEKAKPALEARNLANVTAQVDGAIITLPKPVDLVWTVQNYHDVPNGGGGEAAIDTLNAAVFKALKPGGTYVVIDHADAAGSGIAHTATTHRIDPAVVKTQVLKAGFTLDGESDLLANPADDHSKGVFDPAIRGHTDQFIYRFRKPR